MLVLSCGHPVKDHVDCFLLTLGECYVDQEGYKPCITYQSYCKECYDEALADPELIVLFTAEEEEEYLQYPERFPKGVTK